MRLITKKQIEKYNDKRASCQVLGSLMKDVSFIKLNKYTLNIEDFPNGLHKIIYASIYNLICQGLNEIKIADIETYLHNNNPKHYNTVFENEKNIEWLSKIYEDADVNNFEYYYNIVRKMSLLRNYMAEGIDVSELLDVDEIDHIRIEQQQEKFENMTLEDIQKYFDRKNMNAKKNFIIQDDNIHRKSGDRAIELREQLKQTPPYGFNLESEYLNNITRGALGGKFFLETRKTGCGKSRVAIRRLINICAPYLWDFDKKDFIPNPNGIDNNGLYIGTEMLLYEEIEPMIWAFIAGVDEDRITRNITTTEEEKRVQKAIEIAQKMQLFLEDRPNYNLEELWSFHEQYKEEHNIKVSAIDYLEVTPGLISEYAQLTRGMAVREDQVLLSLSDNCKQIARKFDLTLFGFTQTTDEAIRDYKVRDERAVKGARSLPNKVDTGIVTFNPVKKELKLLEPLINKCNRGLGKKLIPNICYTIYKNRGGTIKDVKIWAYQDLGTMRTIDLFCTDTNYEPIVVDRTKINLLDETNG